MVKGGRIAHDWERLFLSFVILSQRLVEREDLVQYFARGFNLSY
jgi:hypothetical protein